METKKCPFCSEEISIEAIKCKHCGEFLDSKIAKEKTVDHKKRSSGGGKVILFGLLFAALGFAAGYLLFGNVLGQQISINKIFSVSTNEVEALIISPIRNKIIISSFAGCILGALIGTFIHQKD
jgi:hypothetical protein